MNIMKKVLKRVGIAAAVLVVLALGGYIALKANAAGALSKIAVASVDMSSVKDGTYSGETNAGLVYVRVAVTVKEKVPPAVGVPESTPTLESMSPGGGAPDVTEKLNGPSPPDAVMDWL
jgi:uncharacterized protein with FMN-binding domain